MSTDEDGSTAKLKQSYVHNACSFPFQYKTVAQSFDELAAQYPDHECLIFRGEQKRYTYATLKHEIDCLAASFLELGFEKGDRLAVSLFNSSENVVLGYVASKIGIIKVTLNPDSVARELACNLNKAGCKGIVTTPSEAALDTLRKAVPDLEEESCKSVPTLKHIILTGSGQSTLNSFPKNVCWYNELINQGLNNRTRLEGYSVDPESPLSIYFTSGSTGLAKAVVHTNFGVMNALALLRYHYGSRFSRNCIPLSMRHASTGIIGVLLPAIGLCRSVIPALTISPEATIRAIHEEKCTSIITGPTLLRNILAHPTRHQYDLSSLQYVTVTGTPIQAKFLRMMEKEFPGTRFGQGYGMTETGTFITSSLYASSNDDRRHTSIGRCTPHVELKIVDNDGIMLPIASAGEIWIRYNLAMAGYYDDNGKTADVITDRGWLRTGDLATMDEDGYLFFVGRKKEIIIRASANIYPVEVEQVILEHPSVEEAHVFSIPDLLFDEAVCAFVKLKPEKTCGEDELKVFLGENLVAYKVPQHIRFADDFTRSVLGKVSKTELAEEMIKILN